MNLFSPLLNLKSL